MCQSHGIMFANLQGTFSFWCSVKEETKGVNGRRACDKEVGEINQINNGSLDLHSPSSSLNQRSDFLPTKFRGAGRLANNEVGCW